MTSARPNNPLTRTTTKWYNTFVQDSPTTAMSVTAPNPVKTLLEREGYRFVTKGVIELNGLLDYRLQKKDYYTKRWHDIYLFDNQLQCLTAMEDIEYAKWLDPDTVPCYIKGDDNEEDE